MPLTIRYHPVHLASLSNCPLLEPWATINPDYVMIPEPQSSMILENVLSIKYLGSVPLFMLCPLAVVNFFIVYSHLVDTFSEMCFRYVSRKATSQIPCSETCHRPPHPTRAAEGTGVSDCVFIMCSHSYCKLN